MRGGALALLFPGYCAEACASVGKYLPDFAAWRALADANTTPQHLQALQDAARARGGELSPRVVTETGTHPVCTHPRSRWSEQAQGCARISGLSRRWHAAGPLPSQRWRARRRWQRRHSSRVCTMICVPMLDDAHHGTNQLSYEFTCPRHRPFLITHVRSRHALRAFPHNSGDNCVRLFGRRCAPLAILSISIHRPECGD